MHSAAISRTAVAGSLHDSWIGARKTARSSPSHRDLLRACSRLPAQLTQNGLASGRRAITWRWFCCRWASDRFHGRCNCYHRVGGMHEAELAWSASQRATIPAIVPKAAMSLPHMMRALQKMQEKLSGCPQRREGQRHHGGHRPRQINAGTSDLSARTESRQRISRNSLLDGADDRHGEAECRQRQACQ